MMYKDNIETDNIGESIMNNVKRTIIAAEKKTNYTVAQTSAMIADYQAGQSVEVIAQAMGKAVRSVRSKLVREGVYVAAEKTAKAKRDEGPTKKEMLIELETLATFPVEGFMGATKEAIQALISHLKA
jgi:hypothetical protein